MSNSNNDFLIATVDLPDMAEKQLAAQQILAIQDQSGIWDESRNSHVMPLMYVDRLTNHCTWKNYTPLVVKDWAEKYVFPWIGHSTKVVALISPPGLDGKLHIDCAQEDLGSRQHRFRLMLQGNTDDIYFTTKSGQVYAPEIDGPFIMDVGYPHSMRNSSNKPAVLLAFGFPWNGKDHYDPDQVTGHLSKHDYELPADMQQYLVANH